MTRLPEMEVMRKDLERDVAGKRVKDVVVDAPGLVARHRDPAEFVDALKGRKVTAVVRRGVRLVLTLDDEQALIARIGEQGTFSRETAGAQPGPNVGLVATFTTGGALHYSDPGGDAEFYVVPTAELASIAELAKTGIDPLADTFTWPAFGQELMRRATPLKQLLVDPGFIVGLGERYSDEILWNAGLSGNRSSSSLSRQEVRRLYRAVLEVLHDAVKQISADGVPVAREEDDDDEEELPSWQRVWGREGQACARCRQPILFGKVVDGLTSYYCANCQT